MSQNNAVLIIPSLNPDQKLVEVVQKASEIFCDIIIVNDGSRVEYECVFEQIKQTYGEQIHLLEHEQNKGKGSALKTAFSYFLRTDLCERYKGVITMDGDGQHSVEDAKMLDEELGEKNERALHIGYRDLSSPVMPTRSKFGNKATAFLFRFLYGVKLKDTQSGLRAFSSDIVPWLVKVSGQRFEYEMNVLIKSKDAEINVYEHQIQTRYEKNHTSHFRSLNDSYKVMKVLFGGIAKFIFAALCAGVVDLGLFYLIDYVIIGDKMTIALSLLISTFVSRALSSVVNYLVNKFITFGGKKISKRSIIKYYTLWLAQMCASYGIVLGFTSLFGGGEIWIKMVVDLLLSLVSYRAQLTWVFKKKNERKKEEKEISSAV